MEPSSFESFLFWSLLVLNFSIFWAFQSESLQVSKSSSFKAFQFRSFPISKPSSFETFCKFLFKALVHWIKVMSQTWHVRYRCQVMSHEMLWLLINLWVSIIHAFQLCSAQTGWKFLTLRTYWGKKYLFQGKRPYLLIIY